MAAKIDKGDRVEILTGEHKGDWGIVRSIDYYFDGPKSPADYHIAIADGNDAPLLYERTEIRKSRIT